MTRTAQQGLDELARANSRLVSSRPGKSTYTRGTRALALVFSEDCNDCLAMTLSELGGSDLMDWKGRAGNILRSRWRTRGEENDAQDPGAGGEAVPG